MTDSKGDDVYGVTGASDKIVSFGGGETDAKNESMAADLGAMVIDELTGEDIDESVFPGKDERPIATTFQEFHDAKGALGYPHHLIP